MAYTTINDPTQYFNTVLYTGTGSSTSITGVGFQPDLVYTTSRSNGYNNGMFDSSRGVQKELTTNTNNAEATLTTAISSFDSDGFSFSGSAYNTSAYTFVAWNWLANGGTTSSNTDGSITSTVQANTTAGFSIVTYTGTGSNATVGHGLNQAADVIIFKNRSTGTQNWNLYARTLGPTGLLYPNLTNAFTTSGRFQDTDPSSTVFYIATGGDLNQSGDDYVAYCFAEIKGYSKFGSYTGNGSTDGTFVYTGFKPAWLMIKRTDSAGNDWIVIDTTRFTYNQISSYLRANTSDAETDQYNIDEDIVSNGFKLRGDSGNINASGSPYIYMAFAESPFVSSDGVPTTAR